jgi:hypothetical protein
MAGPHCSAPVLYAVGYVAATVRVPSRVDCQMACANHSLGLLQTQQRLWLWYTFTIEGMHQATVAGRAALCPEFAGLVSCSSLLWR